MEDKVEKILELLRDNDLLHYNWDDANESERGEIKEEIINIISE